MYCPKCGQSQAADEVRFCSRCGFALGGVSVLLASNGQLPPQTFLQSAPQGVSPRRRGVKQGGAIMFIGIFVGVALAALSAATGGPEEIGIVGVIIFLAGFLRMLYAAIFQEKVPSTTPAVAHQVAVPQYAPPPNAAQFTSQAQAGALPPGSFRPAQGYFARREDTSEIAPPPSVTDHTTRLLEDERESGKR